MNITDLDFDCALLSELAYGTGEDMSRYGFTNITKIFNEEEDVEAFVCENEKAIFAVFRGTEICEAKDVWRNLKIGRSEKISDYKIHDGFFGAWQAIAAEFATEILERKMLEIQLAEAGERKEKPFVYTGHSQGAAIAHIAAATHRPHKLITFGSPRVGGKKFVEQLENNVPVIRRFTHGADIVTLMPNIGYEHAGENIHLLDGNAYENPSSWERWVDLIFNSQIISDHSADEYTKRVGLFVL